MRPFAPASSGVIESLDDQAEDRESGSLDVGRLGADERRHSFDSGFFGRRALQHGQDAVSTNLATFTVSLAAVARACAAKSAR